MGKKIEIRLGDNPSNGDYFNFRMVVPSEFYSILKYWYFKTSPTVDELQINATKQLTIDDMFVTISDYYSPYSWVTVVKVTDGLDIYIYKSDVSFPTVSTPTLGDITVVFVDFTIDEVTRDMIVYSRSPYSVSLMPTELFDVATCDLFIYRGTLDTDKPTTANYSLSISAIQAGQTKLRFEISKYINDYCKSNIPLFGSGINTTSTYDSVWIETNITAYYLGTSIGSSTKKNYGVDGYGWHTELANPKLTKSVLSNINNHIVYRGSDYPLYFVSKDLISITVGGTSIPFTLDDTINNQLIAYINLKTYITTQDSLAVVFTYADATETHNFTIKDECRFPIYNCFFKNKFGFWQSIPFNLRNKQTIEVSSSDYMPIISSFGNYSLQSHQTKTFMPEVKERITVNTDFITEEYNTLFDELLASEFVYLETEGTYLPVNLKTNSLQRKKRIFDKMIQYTVDFEYSFNKINQVI